MTLIKTSLLNAIATTIKLLTLLGINKFLAVFVGPTGYAALGQFQNVVQMVMTIGSGAINTGVTKYTAEYHDSEAKQYQVWQTGGTIAFICSIVVGLIVVLYRKPLAAWVLKDIQYENIFIWLGLLLLFFVFNTLLLAILNGKKEIHLYVAANVIGSLISLALSATMIVFFGLYGALLALAINQSLVFFATLVLCYRTTWFKFKYIIGRIDRQTAFNLGKYTAMTLVSATTVPLSHMLVRNHLGETLGWAAAGYWDAMWRLSIAYLALVTTTLGAYYLPRLSELRDPSAIKREIIQGYKIILPIASVLGMLIYLSRDQIISLLFTNAFAPMRDLFFWQMLGDTLKIGGWILAYVMLGQALTRMYITTEIIFSFSFYIWTRLFIKEYGLTAAVIAHTINYFIYLVAMVILITRVLKSRRN